ncbi:hypothetical protein BZA70DRAFT_271153 [Myxozyma melibiosi]|uniref:Macro-like domain-containing protein n=1 Tax=Myxozyma melibiosi TaxID=54550 RepID=A0ABR1FC19_9ASCO
MPTINFALTLLDIDPALVRSWSHYLSTLLPRGRLPPDFYPSVQESSLKTHEGAFDCIVSPGNSFARMDGGLDLLISRFFSEPRAASLGLEEKDALVEVLRYVQRVHYRRWKGLQPVGSCYLIDMLPWMAENCTERGGSEQARVDWNRFRCRYIAHSPTMRVPSALWREEIVYECMWSMLNEVYNHNLAVEQAQTSGSSTADSSQKKIERVVVTGLGTGTGGLDREVCARLMVTAYVNFLDAIEAGEESQGEWRWNLAREWDRRISGGKKGSA